MGRPLLQDRAPPPPPAIRLWLVCSWYCLGALGAHEPWGTDGTGEQWG